MNYFWIFVGRALAGIVITFILLGIQFVALGLQKRGDAPLYAQLGAGVSDGGAFHTEWWYWPPQQSLIGTFQGHRFQFQRLNSKFTHLTVACVPHSEWQLSVRHREQIPFTGPLSGLGQRLPGWTALYASPTRVPWRRRFKDQRPLGFGSEPGIDVSSQNSASLSAAQLRSNLKTVIELCADAS